MPTDPPPFRPLDDIENDDLPLDAEGAPIEEDDDQSPQGARGRAAFRQAVRIPLLSVAFLVVLGGVVALVSRGDLRAASSTPSIADAAGESLPIVALDPDDPYTFEGLDIHPDRLFGQYFGGAFTTAALDPGGPERRVQNDFRWRLEMYRKAYGVDDNFTVRVLDERNGETLEVATLRAERDRFRGTGQAAWDQVNLKRRALTTQLRQKWQDMGVPRDRIVIRWGYANQTREARERDARYVPYEVNLARRLGLSVLATEIGTVETFNQDQLVSSAGARSRFQMMPDILSTFNVERYPLRTTGGQTVEVAEERNPLLGMEPSLMLVRAYSNAVGHELPGISAYHTGPGNIFKLYREYLRAFPGLRNAPGRHVSDAYMWGVTDGFQRVDDVSSFGPESRAYVMKAYGALRATEKDLVNPQQAARADLVSLRPGATVTLRQILDALAPHEARLDWGPAQGSSDYEKFRDMNPHIALPAALNRGDVPDNGNVQFTAAAAGKPVRFFLPLGATEVLRRVGLDVVGTVTPFDGQTYLIPDGERVSADRDYDALVADISEFGFTRRNADRLEAISNRMQDLARQKPESRYRQTQAKIIRIHRSIWRTSGFRDLMTTTETLLSGDPRVRMGRDAFQPDSLPGPTPEQALEDLIAF